MILELKDGRLAMYIRTFYGIAVSYSYDKGITWTEATDSGLGGPCARFFIRRLKSGRILLINHYQFEGRNNLTAMLSEDEGDTWITEKDIIEGKLVDKDSELKVIVSKLGKYALEEKNPFEI